MNPTDILGPALDITNTGANLGFGILDRINRDKIQQQQQQNWETQMEFAKAQQEFQEKIFNSNRIGNLTKEYSKAGLNPFLAAGMGASTASVVGNGGNISGALQPQAIQAAKLENTERIFQMSQAKALNEATINKINAEANLANEQAEDIGSTRSYRIDELEARAGMTKEQAHEIVEMTNKIMEEKKLIEAEKKLTESKTTEQDIKNYEAEVKKTILENCPEQYRQKIITEWQNPMYELRLKKAQTEKTQADTTFTNAENKRATSREIRGWIDTILSGAQKATNTFIRASSFGLLGG